MAIVEHIRSERSFQMATFEQARSCPGLNERTRRFTHRVQRVDREADQSLCFQDVRSDETCERQQVCAKRPDSIFFEQPRPALRHHDGIDDQRLELEAANSLRHHLDDLGGCQHACFGRGWTAIANHRVDLGRDKLRRHYMDAHHPARILRGQRGDRTHPVYPKHGEGFEIGLDAGSTARVGTGNRQSSRYHGMVLWLTRAPRGTTSGARALRPFSCAIMAVVQGRGKFLFFAEGAEMSFESLLSREFLRVVEEAAIAAARTMGQGDRKLSDRVAVEAMRKSMDRLPMRGTVVIGEGERDEAPMLYIGEKVGRQQPEDLEVDIAVDPLEGTNLCATGAPGAIAVLAAANKGGLLHAPDCYMEKIIVGPAARGAVHLDATVKENLSAIARRLDRAVKDLVVIVLDRPRHEKLIEDIRSAGARIRLISDGDLSAGISAAIRRTNVHAVMGIGGAPEGVLTAAALRCLNGGMEGRLVPAKPGAEERQKFEERLKAMGIADPNRIYTERDLAPGPDILFAATGVTDGALLRGVRFFGHGARTYSVVMALREHIIRFVDTVHLDGSPDAVVEF